MIESFLFNLYRLFMDDETYVKADLRQLSRLLLFTAQHKFDVLEEVRTFKIYQEQHDLASDLLMWQTEYDVLNYQHCKRKDLPKTETFWLDFASCHCICKCTFVLNDNAPDYSWNFYSSSSQGSSKNFSTSFSRIFCKSSSRNFIQRLTYIATYVRPSRFFFPKFLM